MIRLIRVVALAFLVEPGVNRPLRINKVGPAIGIDPFPDIGMGRLRLPEDQQTRDERFVHEVSHSHQLWVLQPINRLIDVTESAFTPPHRGGTPGP